MDKCCKNNVVEADCEQTVEKVMLIVAALKRVQHFGIGPPKPLYPHLLHAAICADCRDRVSAAGCKDWSRSCSCGLGIDLVGTVCLHPKQLAAV